MSEYRDNFTFTFTPAIQLDRTESSEQKNLIMWDFSDMMITVCCVIRPCSLADNYQIQIYRASHSRR
jgi:hypothetical protein